MTGIYDLLMAEAWPVSVNPGRFRPYEARMRVLARTADLLGDLEVAVRRELGADRGSERHRRQPGDRAESAVS